jgi:starch phosphorylase
LEACGTSGMKAVANGALHLSVLDGWWAEGYDRNIGWAVGSGEEYGDRSFQDDIESKALYNILEKEVVPLFYERGADGLPRRWLSMMRASLHALCPVFNTHRMVQEYWDRFYAPASELGFALMDKGGQRLKELAEWRQKIMFNWQGIAIKDIRMDERPDIEAGGDFHLEADILLGELAPEDVLVEAYCGRLNPENQYLDRFVVIMESFRALREQIYRYSADIRFEDAGRFGLNIRITPNHFHEKSRHSMGLVIWGQP